MYMLSPEKFQLINWPAYLGKAGLQALPFPRRQLFYSIYYVRDNQSLERCRELAAYLLYRFSSGGDINQRIRRKIIPSVNLAFGYPAALSQNRLKRAYVYPLSALRPRRHGRTMATWRRYITRPLFWCSEHVKKPWLS
jgi:hypothetical protein